MFVVNYIHASLKDKGQAEFQCNEQVSTASNLLSGKGPYESVARSCEGGCGFLGPWPWLCLGLYGESSRPILIIVIDEFNRYRCDLIDNQI